LKIHIITPFRALSGIACVVCFVAKLAAALSLRERLSLDASFHALKLRIVSASAVAVAAIVRSNDNPSEPVCAIFKL
jgi:hypothetical protein